jgi:hypothetical protein
MVFPVISAITPLPLASKKSKTAEELTNNSNPFISEGHTGNVADAEPTKTTIIKPTEATEPST